MNNNSKYEISDINEKTTLTLIATMENQKMELPVEFADISVAEREEILKKYKGKVLPIEDIYMTRNEKKVSVSFKGHASKLELLAITENGVYHWDNVQIYKATLESGRTIQVIFSSRLEGEKFNRRRGIRINIDKKMDIEQNGEKQSVIVRDISYCGMSFIEPDNNEVETGTEFVLYLTDTMDDEERLVGTFNGKILNKRNSSGGQVICGCVISAEHAAFLQRYIAMKQMEIISGKKNAKILTKVKTGEYWQDDLAEAINDEINESL